MENDPNGDIDESFLDRLNRVREERASEHEALSSRIWALTPEEKERHEVYERFMERQPMVELRDSISKLPATVAEYLKSKDVAPDKRGSLDKDGGEEIPVWLIREQTSTGYFEVGSNYSYTGVTVEAISGEALGADGIEYTLSGNPDKPTITPKTPHYSSELHRWTAAGNLAYYEWKNDIDITEKRNWRDYVADNNKQLRQEFGEFMENCSDDELREYCKAIYGCVAKFYTNFALRKVSANPANNDAHH